jgi:predicted O-methyltransferase YrrM
MNKIDLLFQQELAELYNSGKSEGRSGKKIDATGLSSINNLLTIRNIILDKKPTKTLEVGLAYGGSAVTILRSLADGILDGNFEHSAIDPGQEGFDYAGVEIVKRIGFEKNFHFQEGPSDLILPKLAERGERFDLIYIDGYHLFENVFVDMYYSLKILNDGGILLFDDCADKHIKKVIRFMAANLTNIVQKFALEKYEPPKSWLKRFANKLGYRQMKAFEKKSQLPRVWNAPFVDF